MPFRMFLLAVLVAALPLAAACGANDDDETTTPSTTANAQASPTGEPSLTPGASATTGVPFEGTTEPTTVEKPPTIPPILLVDVRVGKQAEGYDRIVFEFDSAVPSYKIEYVVPPIQLCGPGFDADIEGDAMLSVVMRQVDAHDQSGQRTVPATELKPAYPAMVEAEQTCDFEATVEWGVGLTAEVPYRVTELQNPPRLAVDVLHP